MYGEIQNGMVSTSFYCVLAVRITIIIFYIIIIIVEIGNIGFIFYWISNIGYAENIISNKYLYCISKYCSTNLLSALLCWMVLASDR